MRKFLDFFSVMLSAILTIAVLIATAVVCSGYVLTSTASVEMPIQSRGDSLALAPLSLGNPVAVPGIETASPEVAALPTQPNPPKSIEYAVTVERGDTLAKVLVRVGIGGRDAHAAIRAFSKAHNPRRIRKGDSLRIIYKPHIIENQDQSAMPGTFIGFGYNASHEQEIRVLREDDGGFTSQTRNRSVIRQAVRLEVVITSSLYMAGKKRGLSDSTLAELIRLFSWDVDFQRDVRKNDSFQVMYNHITDEDGRAINGGKIFFAALTLSGKRKAIYRFKGDDGHTEYFDENGHSAQKALMRTPIDGARLSSGFGRRRHPILGYTKMHRGVDFAAPRGTPIYAAGNGTIEYASRKGGYGKYVRIRHNHNYKTAYAHMKGFARGIRKGRRVTQGQIIGYVGTTGRSTGPHLHYEILRSGRQLNPMRVRMPSGRKLKGDGLARFQKLRATLDHRYALLPKLALATTQH